MARKPVRRHAVTVHRRADRPRRDCRSERRRAGPGLHRGRHGHRHRRITKLDGTAKGGIVVRVQQELGIPVKLIGLGEGPDDLAPFEARTFAEGLVGGADQSSAGSATRSVVEGPAPPHTGTALRWPRRQQSNPRSTATCAGSSGPVPHRGEGVERPPAIPSREPAPCVDGASIEQERTMRRTAMLSGLILMGGLLGPSTALASQDDGHDAQLRWIAVEDEFAIVLPNGETFTGEEEGGPRRSFRRSVPASSSARRCTRPLTGRPWRARSAARTSSARHRSSRRPSSATSRSCSTTGHSCTARLRWTSARRRRSPSTSTSRSPAGAPASPGPPVWSR